MWDRVLRFIDITLALTFVMLSLYGYYRKQILHYPKDFKDVQIMLGLMVFLAGSVAMVDYFSNQPLQEVTISTTGVVLAQQGGDFGAYWDVTGTSEVYSIDWEVMDPGENKTIMFWIKNEDTQPIFLNMTHFDYVPPEAANYMTLYWEWGDTYLYPNMSRRVYISLYIHSDITGVDTFQFNIQLTS